MKCFLRILAGVCLLLAPLAGAQTNPSTTCSAAAAPPPVAPILPGEFLGWTNAFRLENEQVAAVLVPDIGGLDLAIDQAIPNARVIDLSAVPGAEGVDGYDPFDLLARHGVEMGRKYLRGLFREARDASL